MKRQTSGRFGRLRVRMPVRLFAASAFLLLTACSGAQQADEAASPAPEPVASAPAAVTPSPPMTSEASSEPADVTVSGVDYAFEVGDISAGDTVGFVNESDVEFHEMAVQRVTDDTITLEDIQQLLEQDPDTSPPAYIEDVGHTFAAPGETGAQTMTLDAGRYLLLCFVPENAPVDVMEQLFSGEELPSEQLADVMSGPPHAALGMIDLIEVE